MFDPTRYLAETKWMRGHPRPSLSLNYISVSCPVCPSVTPRSPDYDSCVSRGTLRAYRRNRGARMNTPTALEEQRPRHIPT